MKGIRSERGLSLLEVLASITIFSVVAAGLAATTMGSIKSNAASKDIAAASALVQSKIEQLRALDPTTIPFPSDLTPGSHPDTASNPMGPLGQAGGKFTRTWTVTANTPRKGLSLVAVTVTWSSPDSRSLTNVTYFCVSVTCS